MARLILLLALLVPGINGQTTWQNLTFGMTEMQTRETLKSLKVADIRQNKQKQPNNRKFYFPFEVTGFDIVDMPGTASLLFSASTRTLAQVQLDFALPEKADPFDRRATGSLIREYLTKRYGNPVLFTCGNETMFCDATWRDQGQTIDFKEHRVEFQVNSILTVQAPTGIHILYKPSKDAGVGL